jgi:hypothetical protein
MIYPDFYPFYATQGSPGFYNEEREQEKEFDLMRSYYPDTARRIQEKAEAQCPGTVQHIQEKIEEECDLMDYEGSRLYDEYPDRFMLYHICHQVKGQMEGDTSVQEIPGGFLDDLIEVLVYQEISRRRCRRRRCRKCFRTEY